jgi:ATP-dependent helicase HrpA
VIGTADSLRAAVSWIEMAVSSPADLRSRLGEVTLRDEARLSRKLERARRGKDEAALARVAEEIERAEARVATRRAAVPAVSYPPELPVSASRDALLEAIRDNQVVVVAGETGSGKTTQLPKICLELGRGVRGMIGHTQPRRLAARTVAERIADELKVPLGAAVGYAIRFSDRSREDTLVRLMTDGLLLAEIQSDRLLQRYDTIIVDEAHERSLNIDFLLGYLARILPRRPDLKVIVTSATIDPDRFAAHFGGAPVVEVSGRTYPVEVRYEPIDEDSDQTDAIGDAVDTLLRQRADDVLVFLSGEREIRDTADVLGGRLGPNVDVLPLYARLSAAAQARVFKPHGKPRVVLATNVAETSLTVPGIRSVVDPGTARLSRYSTRLKVQQLPIEPISQASADQRKGRSGRTSPGTCIRLYSEEDFAERPRFTDPEILRTNLASVILQMAAAGLGEIEDFPFLDPPDRRQVRAGITLLQELGALDGASKLTPLGRRLAQLPVDPRMGRMVLEADRLGCADEVIVIAAALSIQDPRERPADKQAQADQAHARFRDETSDFLSLLAVWRYLREQQRELSGSAFRRLCKAEYVNYLRVREWQDLVSQLRAAAKGVGVTINREPAEAREIHVALLSALLSHVGMKEPRGREYMGARGTRFALFPGSGLARSGPAWVMVAELMETSRLWGLQAAAIDPAWIEPLAEHLVQRSYSEPRWVRRRASVMATERVTLYGLPVVTDRTVAYGRIDPVLSRELFIRRALVEGEWDTRHEFVAENRRRIEEVRAREDRARRRDLLVGDEVIFDFYDERVPASVVSGAHFDRWWRDADHSLLVLPRSLLIDPAAAGVDEAGRPAEWKQGEHRLRLSYEFDPGSAADGVTVHVPLALLGEIRSTGFDWLVPALRLELVTALLRGLPKELRRPLVPIPSTAEAVVEALQPRRGPIVDQVAAAVERLRGVRIPAGSFDVGRLPSHLRMRFAVEDSDGTELAAGDSLEAVRALLRPRLRARLSAAAAGLERTGMTSWELDALPRVVALPGTGQAVRAYPALADEGSTVGVRVLDTPAAAASAMWAGTRRLLLLGSGSPVRAVSAGLGNAAQLALASAPGGPGATLSDCVVAAADALMREAGGPAWDAAGFARLRDAVAGSLVARSEAVVRQVVAVLGAAREVSAALEPLTAVPLQPARADVRRQLARLVYPGFVAEAGAERLGDIERYLRAALRRLERLPSGTAPDLDRMRSIHELEEAYRSRVAALGVGEPVPESLGEVKWMLEELRVSHFAQHLGRRGPVSAKRIRAAIAGPR